ncbi:MAG TPA: hypothetical protein EYQ69_09610 [Gemmatimonadetes bacterium]|nr:hypothetical protein [Gemmatimonadota bacterium]
MDDLNMVSTVAGALSERAKIAVASQLKNKFVRGDVEIPERLVENLSYHLGKGETHYPDRPGMLELRKCIGKELGSYLDDPRDQNEVLVTASEGEAVFVTMLGLDLVPEGGVVAQKELRHQALFDWMGIRVYGLEDTGIPVAYWELDSGIGEEWFKGNVGTKICAFGNALYGEGSEILKLASDTIMVGSLSSLLGIHGFDLGFVSAEASLLKRITSWKQASSICAPSPSQRVALWALGERP